MRRLGLDYGGVVGAKPDWHGPIVITLVLIAVVQAVVFYSLLEETRKLSSIQEQGLGIDGKAGHRGQFATVDPVEFAAAEEISRQLHVPWEQLFGALEAVVVEGVEVKSIQSDPKSGRMTVVARAQSVDGMLTYVKILSSRTPFTSAYVTHHAVRERSQGGGIEFVWEASW